MKSSTDAVAAELDPPPPAILDGAALFLDFDGTLVELAEAPEAIEVPGHLNGLLTRLAERLGGRLAIVSGRALSNLDGHVDASGIALSGSHGLELRLAGGALVTSSPTGAMNAAAAEVSRFARSDERLLVEAKPFSIAVHFRKAPERAQEVTAFLERKAEESGLTVQLGNMVAELRPASGDKGDAVEALMAEPGFAGARPVFVGDDLTDEDGFEAAARMGGAGILVGPARPSAATYRLPDVASVAAWLGDAAKAA